MDKGRLPYLEDLMEKHEDITLLKFPDCVRVRSGMYIGSTENPSVLLREIIDNSIDECYVSDSCNKIEVINSKGTFIIKDNGRGIPTRPSNDNKKITQARLSVSSLHSGSKFKKTAVQSGLNGVGASVTNALSSEYILKTRVSKEDAQLSKIEYKENLFYICRFTKGVFKSEEYIIDDSEKMNTIISFKPDPSIFESLDVTIPSSLSYAIYICEKVNKKSINITINGTPYSQLLKNYRYFIDKEIKSTESNTDYCRFLIDVDFQEDFSEPLIQGSVNGLICNQGLHINNVQKALSTAFNLVFSRKFGQDSILRGLSIRVICLAPEVSYASQTKERLTNIKGFSSRTSFIADNLMSEFRKMIKSDMPNWKLHLDKVIAYTSSIDKIGRKELIESKIATLSSSRPEAYLPYKLVDCSSKDRSICELYLCEGNSAGGSLIKSRNPEIHAILPLRGKVKNATNLEIEEALNNKEICDILNCIGIGTTDVNNVSKLRYGKIIIATDEDMDGQQISALLLGNLYRHCEILFDLRKVYIARSPFYKIENKKKKEYYYSDEYDKVKGRGFERIKGLGQMEPDDIKWAFYDHPKLIQITKDNYEVAISLLTSASAKREVMIEKKVIDFHILGKRGQNSEDVDNTDYEALFLKYDNNPQIQELLRKYSELDSEEDKNDFIQKLSTADSSILMYLQLRG